MLYGIKILDCLGIPSLKYIASNKEIALEGVKLLQKNYKYTTMGSIFLIEYDPKELINVSNLNSLSNIKGTIIGVYHIESSPCITDKQYQKIQNEFKIIRESNKITLEYEGLFGSSVLLRVNLGGLVNRYKFSKRLRNFIKKFNSSI